jgi:hypothetical protein
VVDDPIVERRRLKNNTNASSPFDLAVLDHLLAGEDLAVLDVADADAHRLAPPQGEVANEHDLKPVGRIRGVDQPLDRLAVDDDGLVLLDLELRRVTGLRSTRGGCEFSATRTLCWPGRGAR